MIVMEKIRCINLDWLEVYALEDFIGYPHDADFFRRQGFYVEEREYGTPVYKQMFVLFGTDDCPLIEVRREPKSAVGKQVNGVLDPNATHVRLVNRSCYLNNPAGIMQNFLETYGLHYQRISRLDIALDFERFDYGDLPAEFVRRYMAGRYAKINQANISAHGKDQWDGRIWNSLKWGQEKSMISTKLYNKSLEIEQVHDKPYIRQAWKAAGLVDDSFSLIKDGADGLPYKPEIWRLEFSIKSGTRNWFIIEDNNGARRKIKSIKHNLSMYATKQQWIDVFFSLVEHYFHFKKYKPATRKDRCPDKLLFNPKEQNYFYKLENVATAETREKVIDHLIALLLDYRESHATPNVFNACNTLLEQLEFEARTVSIARPWPKDEILLLRQLIAKRIRNHDHTLDQDKEEIKTLIDMYDNFY